MTLLWGTCYDPAAAVTKACTAALAMTALDTTNLRATFNAPANGTVLVRLQGTITGAATFPQILLGVMSGATVVERMAPKAVVGGTALATTMMDVEALFLVTGLTPAAAQTWDAAYGVEFAVASSNLRYGGPNNTTASDAFGGFVFEVWSTA